VIPELIRGVLPGSPMLLMVIGFLPEDQDSVLGLAPASSQVIDLDTIDPGIPVDDPVSGPVAVIARTLTDLRRAASLAALLPKATHHVIAVAMSSPDRPFSPAVASPDRPAMVSFQAQRGPAGDWSVEARFTGPSSVGEFVAALVRGLGGNRLQTMPGPRIALAGAGASHWRPGDPGVTLTTMSGPLGDPDGLPPADLVLRSTGPEPSEWSDPRMRVVIDRPQADQRSPARPEAADGIATMAPPYDVDAVPPVDERSVNPIGFISTPQLGDAVLTQTGDRWSVQADPENLVRFHPSGVVTDADVARLRQLRAVTIEWGRDTAPIAAARVVAGLAAAGVPLRAAHVPPWAMALGGELADLITGVGESDLADDLRREEHSIRLRRTALRSHSTEARWRNLAGAAGLPMPPRPTVSVVLCTRRPEFLDFALRQIARQRHVDLELILTLHGIPADLPEVKAAVAGFDRPITVVEVPADVLFGAALNHGVARASGRYVAKWDDDDWYGPDFLADMMLASSYTGAELVGCHAQFIYLGQIDLTIYRIARSEWMGRWISGGTLFIERSALDSVGGFPLVPRHVDAALLNGLSAVGARIYRTHSLGYALHRRAIGHTWNQPITHFLRTASLQWRGLRFSAFIDSADTPLPLTSVGSVPK
jgi:hypothetical protein